MVYYTVVLHGVLQIYVMKIPIYDSGDNEINYKQMYDFMPNQCFQMLICGPSGSGKTNTLIDMLYNLIYCDRIYSYAKKPWTIKISKLN